MKKMRFLTIVALLAVVLCCIAGCTEEPITPPADMAFALCTELESVTMGSQIHNLGEQGTAFAACDKMVLYYGGSDSDWETQFSDIPSRTFSVVCTNGTIPVPEAD